MLFNNFFSFLKELKDFKNILVTQLDTQQKYFGKKKSLVNCRDCTWNYTLNILGAQLQILCAPISKETSRSKKSFHSGFILQYGSTLEVFNTVITNERIRIFHTRVKLRGKSTWVVSESRFLKRGCTWNYTLLYIVDTTERFFKHSCHTTRYPIETLW